MNKNEKKTVKNPRQGANALSALTFKWLFGTFLTGYKRELGVSDLYTPLDEHSSRLLGNKISRLWNEELERCQKSKKAPSLFRVLWKYFGCNIMVFGLYLGFLEFVIKTTQPIILANLLRYFAGNHAMEKSEAYYWGTGIVLGVFLDGLITHASYQGQMHTGMKIRVACCSLIYRKVLKISKVAVEGDTSMGQIINLLSNDVNRLDYSVYTLHYIWIAPLQIAIISYLLYREIGLAAIGGTATLLLFIPIHGCFGKLTSHLTLKFAYRTDERLRQTNEVITGLKVIKMYAWEKPFAYLIDKARQREAKVIRNDSMATQIFWSFESYIPRVCLFVTILAYILLGNNIDAEKVYLVTAYYNVLRNSLYRLFPLGIKEIAEALVSIKRIRKFLLFEEIKQKSVPSNDNKSNSKTNDDFVLSFNNVTAKWNLVSKIEALKQISFQLKSDSLTAVIGQVGAGKTALFQAILQEIPDIKGEIKINGKISYASQEPWIFASSIKQNILFGKLMNKERYEKVIEVCQLKRDFQLLPFGENTLVGEKGINLSGGQCARVNLARAVYHEADIYLLDDPLSAVDTHVGKGIFEDCVKTFLKDKTVILITHQFHFLKHVDRIIVIGDGTVMANGSYSDILNSGLSLTKLIQLESESDEISDDNKIPAKENGIVANALIPTKMEEEQSESRTVGSITSKTYLQYFKAARNGCLIFIVFLICICCQITATGADYFITYWVNVEEGGNFTSTSEDDLFRGRGWYIYVYGSITILSALVTLAQAHTFFHMCMIISRNLHAMMFTSVIKTKMAFFTSNPIGRIMNRFSKDMGIVDTRIPQTIIDVTKNGLYTISVVAIVASVNPWFLVAALVIVVITYFFRVFYIKTSRAIKRLEGITRSPVFSHLSASVHGLTTIRALNAQQILTNEFDNHQDLHSSAWFIFFSGSKAFGMYIEFLCAVFTGIVIYTLLLLMDTVMAGYAGLLITQCMLMTGTVQWGVRQTTELENCMTSVERILEYSNLEQEPLLERTAENKAPEKWPEHGKISFKDVNLTYGRQEEPALRNLNFIIQPNEMIGIVGRTGAGKSSIINALFRLADIKGDIYIDNIATSKIALQDLRSKISIIPQEPVLFAGSLRRNLDPLEKYSDDLLWKALEDVELKEFVKADQEGLNIRVAEGGMNFSVGQRQLLCLARAIVRNNKILVIDEATANVDLQTDELIQKAIRNKFVNCTIIIIAHRLNTVMDSDQILVMDAGQVVEFDHPHNLLQQRAGVFYRMVQETGTSTAESLFEVAKYTDALLSAKEFQQDECNKDVEKTSQNKTAYSSKMSEQLSFKSLHLQ